MFCSPRALSLLGEMAAQPAFKHWELVDNVETLWVDHAYIQEHPAELIVDLLHKAAFREGSLGNSLFAHDFNIGKVKHEALAKFAVSRIDDFSRGSSSGDISSSVHSSRSIFLIPIYE